MVGPAVFHSLSGFIMTFTRVTVRSVIIACMAVVFLANSNPAAGQSLALSDLPGFDRVTAAREALNSFRGGGASNIRWSVENNLLYFSVGGERQQINLVNGEIAKWRHRDMATWRHGEWRLKNED